MTGQMEAQEQQVAGAGNQGRLPVGRTAPGAPADSDMLRGARFGHGGARPLPIPAPAQAGPPLPSQDAIDVASMIPLIKMVRSQVDASMMQGPALDRWHQHGKLFVTYKIAPFGEVPMTPGAQQKLLIWLKDTAPALVAYRTTSLEHEAEAHRCHSTGGKTYLELGG